MDRVQELAGEVVALRQQGRRVILHVANVNEAIDVAARLQDLGEAQWFRGQVQNWPKLTPSLHRLSEAEFSRAEDALQRFGHWAQVTPGLEDIAVSTDALLAVAQHYGMPTSFLDFTTDPRVAGYFASASKEPPPPETESCIYCLDVEEADHLWKWDLDRYESIPERLVIDVSNLWRLEAQNGVFVYCPYDDLNGPFPIDRIVFSYQGSISTPTDAEMYPERESPLEARLREYFQSEEIVRGSVVFTFLRDAGVPQSTFESQPFMEEYFVTTPTPHSSWNDAQIANWRELRREGWSDVVVAPELLFKTDLRGPLHEEAALLEDFVRRSLCDRPMLRRSMVMWRVSAEGDNDTTVDRLIKVLQRVWDEMVRLPWTDEEIALTLSAVLLFFLTAEHLRRTQGLDGRSLENETVGQILTRPVRVELGSPMNIHTWAWVEERDLHAAVRPDFESLLRPESRDQIVGHTFNTLMVARTPSLLFDFGKLSALFAKQMIPTQAVFYRDHPLFPTPARVEVIGPE